MRTNLAFLFATLFAAGLLPLYSFAAQDDSGGSPLTVTAQFSNDAVTRCEAGSAILLQFHYAGTQPLRGYLVVVGSPKWVSGISTQTVQEIRALSEPMIQPGADWTRTMCLKSKSAAPDPSVVRATIDVLKFADGSNWGPKELRQSSELLGAFDGMDFSVKTTDIGYKITLDFVVFADGSTFGPKRSRESDELLGMIDGIHMANAGRDSASNQPQ